MESGVLGHLAVAVAFAFNAFAGIGFFLTARGNRQYENLAKLSYNIFTGAVAVAVVVRLIIAKAEKKKNKSNTNGQQIYYHGSCRQPQCR